VNDGVIGMRSEFPSGVADVYLRIDMESLEERLTDVGENVATLSGREISDDL
jgi:hypothetical protein